MTWLLEVPGEANGKAISRFVAGGVGPGMRMMVMSLLSGILHPVNSLVSEVF